MSLQDKGRFSFCIRKYGVEYGTPGEPTTETLMWLERVSDTFQNENISKHIPIS